MSDDDPQIRTKKAATIIEQGNKVLQGFARQYRKDALRYTYMIHSCIEVFDHLSGTGASSFHISSFGLLHPSTI